MKWKLRILKFLATLFILGMFSGCNAILGIDQEAEQQVPQAQPAPWEGQVPGMPTPKG